MKFFCIADGASSLGFKLAGVETREVSGRGEALEALRVAAADGDVGIILVTRMAASLMEDELDKLMYSRKLPLILEIPSRGEIGKRKSSGEVLKKAIGISV